MFKVNNQETRTTSTVSLLLILHILVSLMLTLDTLYILRDIKYAEIRLSLICIFTYQKLGKIRIRIRIRENPYWGLFHPLLLWCFYCRLWTGSCIILTIVVGYYKIWKKKKSNKFNSHKKLHRRSYLGFKYVSGFWRLFKRFIF